jgi:hypothetical protein
MVRFLLGFLILAIASPVDAQSTFSLEYHGGTGDQAVDVVEQPSGDLLVLGYVLSGSNSDIVLTSVSPTGVVQQSRTIPTSAYEIPKSITLTSDGGYFITASTFTNPSDYDMLLVKLDSAFNITFQKIYRIAGANENGNRGFEIAPGLYGVAASIGLSGSTKPAFIVVDSTGIVRHEAYLNTNFFASPDYSGTYVGNGVLAMVHLTNAITLMDTAGTVLGNYSNNIGTYTTDVLPLPLQGYACIAASDFGGPTGGTISLGIIDSSLVSLIAGAKFKSAGTDLVPVSFCLDASGNFYIAANATGLSTGSTMPLLIKTTPSGSLLWCKSFRPAAAPDANVLRIRMASDGTLLLCGSAGPWNNQHMYFNKVDTSGYAPCNWSSYTLTQQAVTSFGQSLHSAFVGTMPAPVNGSAPVDPLTLTTDALCTGATGILDSPESPGKLTLLPSVFDNQFKVMMEESGLIRVEIFTSSGQRVVSGYIYPGETIDASNWPAGICQVVAYSASGKVFRASGIHIK